MSHTNYPSAMGYARKTALYTLYAVAVGVVCCMLFGCKSIQYVPVETVRYERIHDTTRIVLCEYDSIIVQDSVALEHYKDSIDKYYQLHREVRLRFVHDTVDKVKEVLVRDSVEVPVKEYVEKELSWKENAYLNIGKYTWWIWLILLLIGVLWLAKKVYLRR